MRIWNSYGAWLSAAGRLDDAEQGIREPVKLRLQGSSKWVQLAGIHSRPGAAEAALEAARKEPERVWRDIARAMALQAGKDRAAADAAPGKYCRPWRRGGWRVAGHRVAQVHALRDDACATFEWLERARDPGMGMGNARIDPLVMRYKNAPRLAAFCKSVGLPAPTQSQTKGL